jgi:RNA polymerase sigma-70 factor (ECF subfamily)
VVAQQQTTFTDLSDRTDEQLVAEAARESSGGAAFSCLMDRYRQKVWGICFRLMGNEHDANDAAQEVFVRLFLNRTKFAGRSKYSTWLHGVAVRTCLTLRRSRSRRHKRVAVTSDPPERSTSMTEATSKSLELDLMQMLETLNEEDRAMLILKYAEGHGYEELAEMFELSVSACKMRLSRAREKLKERFPDQR